MGFTPLDLARTKEVMVLFRDPSSLSPPPASPSAIGASPKRQESMDSVAGKYVAEAMAAMAAAELSEKNAAAVAAANQRTTAAVYAVRQAAAPAEQPLSHAADTSPVVASARLSYSHCQSPCGLAETESGNSHALSLHVAAEGGDTAALRRMLDAGYDVDGKCEVCALADAMLCAWNTHPLFMLGWRHCAARGGCGWPSRVCQAAD
jgi:hypothetical protein